MLLILPDRGESSIIYDSQSNLFARFLNDDIPAMARSYPANFAFGHSRGSDVIEIVDRSPTVASYEVNFDRTMKLCVSQCNSPKYIIFQITNECNFHCRYCYQRHLYRNGNRKTITLEIAKKVIDRLKPREGIECTIGYYGGEPLLYPSLVYKIDDYARYHIQNGNINCQRSITTNGSFLDISLVGELIQRNIHIQISLDGPQLINDNYRKAKNGQSTFQKVLDNIQNAYAYFGERFKKMSTIMATYDEDILNSNYNEIEEFTSNLKKYVHFVHINPTRFSDSLRSENHYQSLIRDISTETKPPIYVKRFIECVKEGNLQGMPDLARIVFFPILESVGKAEQHLEVCNALPQGQCMPGHHRLFVDVGGNLYPCEKSDYLIGDANTGVNSEFACNLIMQFYSNTMPHCRKCWAIRLCTRKCIALMNKYNPRVGIFGDHSPLCNTLKSELIIAIYAFIHLKEKFPHTFIHYFPNQLPSIE